MEFMERLEGISSLYRWLAIPVFVLLLAVLYWYFLYQPYSEEMAALQERITSKQQTVEKYQKIAAQLETFRTQVSELEARLHALLRELPESREIPGMIRQISDLGVRTGLQIISSSPCLNSAKSFMPRSPFRCT